MRNARCAMSDERWAMGDGRWAMGDGRWAMGDGRWAINQAHSNSQPAHGSADSEYPWVALASTRLIQAAQSARPSALKGCLQRPCIGHFNSQG
ncbi:hypothetical protein PMIT1320_00088 [Prochlorococcus marinus str. MIT 1320]|nr:hypothetical protein PMIT1320_00088 [Prochlorococcus marinus str. MIT 1320]